MDQKKNVDFICIILKCGPLRLSHSRTCPILGTPPLHDVIGVEEDVHLLGRTETQLVKAEQHLDVQVCCHPPGMVDHAKLCLHGVWLIFNGKKPNLVMTKRPSG